MIRMATLHPYDCQVCQGDLYLVSENPWPNNQILSYFKCMACQAEHYHVEEIHVLPTQAVKACSFCNKQLDNFGLKDSWSDYWKCDPCRAHYSSWLEGASLIANSIFLYTTIRGHTYCLRQYLDQKISRLEMIPDDPEDTLVIVKEFDFLFPDVNPTNIHDKLSIYILFS